MKFLKGLKNKTTDTAAGAGGGATLDPRLLGPVAALGAVLLASVLAFLFVSWTEAALQDAQDRRNARAGDQVAQRVATFVGTYREELARLAADTELPALIASGSAAAREQWVATAMGAFSGSARLRLVSAGHAGIEPDASPPISYAVLDLFREAERKRAAPPAELHVLGTGQRYVMLVQPVLADAGVAGHLLLGLDVELVGSALSAAAPLDGYLEVQQVSPKGGVVVLASHGDAAVKSGTAAGWLAPIRGSRWQVARWAPDGGTGFDGSLRSRLWTTYAAVIAAIAVFLLGLFWWLAGTLRRDMAILRGLLREPDSPVVRPVRLAPCREVADLVRSGAAGRTRSHGAQAAARADVDELGTPPMPDGSDIGVDILSLDPNIFRAYDIRGIVEQNLTPEVVYEIGQAIGSEAYDLGQQKLVVGRDGRLSGPQLSDALIEGLVASGRDVVDVGMVPTPLVYFATSHLKTGSGVMVTGSHNPPEYNGMKIMLAGETLAEEAIQKLRRRVEKSDFLSGSGNRETVDIVSDYVARVSEDVKPVRGLKVVVDCGNGVAGVVAPQLLKTIGCEVSELYCDVDGTFPNHHPDPGKEANMADLVEAVKTQGADVGLAFDGDGDRLGVVASDGTIIWPDRLLMLFAIDVLNRNPGAEIIYDVKCSRHLAKIVADFGGKPLMWKTGHSLIKAKLRESGALLAGEMSGHIFFKERWYGFDDALYSAARLVEILAQDHRTSDRVFATLPDSVNTPELNVGMAEGEPPEFMRRLAEAGAFGDGEVIDIDGIRVEYPDGWGLVRASNTTPCLVLRFEADDREALARIQDTFRQAMKAVKPDLDLPF